MAEYIDKSALVAEIERIKKEECPTDSYEGRCKLLWFEQFLSFIDTLEVKEIEEDEDLHGIQRVVAYDTVGRINRKRIPINLKGDMKAKFKNEFNTMWQVIDGIKFAKVAKHIIERLCLEFATWGAYNLNGIGEINSEEKKKMDIML